jgi:arylformamidase
VNGAAAYMGFSRPDLDREYNPSSTVPSLDFYLDEYARRSAAARRRHLPHTDLSYGPAPQARLDLFLAEGENTPLVVFVHGGYWQEVTKQESAFAAPDVLAAGAAFAVIDYGLAPEYQLDEIVGMVRSSVTWLHRNATRFGIDPHRIHLSGSCAGAQLVTMALIDEHAPPIAGAILLSGIYDLAPLLHTSVNDALGLDLDAALRNSPAYHLPRRLPPIVIARGRETREFARQHCLMTGLLRQRTEVTEIVCPERNHFDLPYDLADPHTPLGKAVLAGMGAT